MKNEAVDELWARAVLDDPLDEAEERALVAVFEDREQRHERLEDFRLHGAARAWGARFADEAPADRFVRDFIQRAKSQETEGTFVEAVAQRMRIDKLRSAKRRRALIAFGGLGALAAGILMMARSREPAYRLKVASTARIESVDGNTELTNARGTLPAQPGQRIDTGDSLRLWLRGHGGRVVVGYPDGTQLTLAKANTLVRDFSEERGKQLFIEVGQVQAEVARQPHEQPLVLRTPNARVTVVGTRLTLVVQAYGTRVEVESGAVRVRPLTSANEQAAEFEVTAGHYLEIVLGQAPIVRALPLQPSIHSFSLLDSQTGIPVPGLDPLPDDAVIPLATLPPSVTLRANTIPELVEAVRFLTDDAALGREVMEAAHPYTLPGGPTEAGTRPGFVFLPWVPAAGTVTLSASICIDKGNNCPGPSRRLSLRFVGPGPPR